MLAALLALGGCGDDPAKPAPASNQVRFDALALGQESLYLFFDCDRYGEPDSATQTYQPDTLLVALVAAEGEAFRVRESLTPGSASLHGATHLFDPTAVYEYLMSVAQDSMLLRPLPGTPYVQSRLFGYWPSELSLQPIAGPETQFIGWQPAIPYHESFHTAYVANHAQMGTVYDRLNVVQDNRPMQTDGAGHLVAYSGAHGLVRTANYGWWTRSGHGWDLVP